MEGYKVLERTLDGQLCSPVMYGSSPYYRENTEVRPLAGAGPLCVFQSLSEAIRWASSTLYVQYEVYRCEYTRSRGKYVWGVGEWWGAGCSLYYCRSMTFGATVRLARSLTLGELVCKSK
jgi:hypothetical protein